MAKFIPILFIIVALFISKSLVAAPVRGLIRLSAPPAKTIIPPLGYWLLPNEWLDLQPPNHNPTMSMIIVVEGNGTSSHCNPIKPIIRLEDGRFNPLILPIAPNTPIKFENVESTMNLIESLDGTVLPPTRIDSHSSVEHTFTVPGTYRIHSAETPHMLGTVLVIPSACFAMPDITGAFTISDLKPGTYTLRVWHREKWIHQQLLKVKGKTIVVVQLQNISEKD